MHPHRDKTIKQLIIDCEYVIEGKQRLFIARPTRNVPLRQHGMHRSMNEITPLL
jgi:hypothetical protein